MLNRIKSIDKNILLKISKLHRPILNKIMILITKSGNTGAIWLLISVPMLLNVNHRNNGVKLILSLLLSGFMGEIIIKRIVCRIRPFKLMEDEQILIKHPSTYSFPSGHTSSSFAAALTISSCYSTFTISSFCLAFLIAFSRIYLKVHYPSDLLAGAVLGILCSLAVNSLYPV